MAINGKIGPQEATLQVGTRFLDGRAAVTTLEIDVDGVHLEFAVAESSEVAALARAADNAASHWAKGGSKACGPWNGHRDAKPHNASHKKQAKKPPKVMP